MAIGGAFLGGGVEVVPAGSCKLELEILTEDRANLTATFTIKGTSTYTVTAGADGRAVYTVPSGQTYTVSVNTTGYDNIASQTVVAESGTVRYVRFEAFESRVKRSGDVVSGTLTFYKPWIFAKSANADNIVLKNLSITGSETGSRNMSIDHTDNNNTLRGQILFSTNKYHSSGAYLLAGNGSGVTQSICVVVNENGTYNANAPTPTDSADNSTQIATTAWVNGANSVVHTDRDETIQGYKKFSKSPITTAWTGYHVSMPGMTKGEKVLEHNTNLYTGFFDKNDTGTNQPANMMAGLRFTVPPGTESAPPNTFIELSNQYYRDTYLRLYDNGTTAYATCPNPPSDATTNQITTASWTLGKFVQKSGDTITGELTFKGDPKIRMIQNSYTMGTAPSENRYWTFARGYDSTGNKIAMSLQGYVNSSEARHFEVAMLTNAQAWKYPFRIVASADYSFAEVRCVTPSSKGENSTMIATTEWVNKASSVVHTSNDEIIQGVKTFTSPPFINIPINAGSGGNGIFRQISFADNNNAYRGGIRTEVGNIQTVVSLRAYDMNGMNPKSIEVVCPSSGDGFALAPTTPANAKANQIATADWVNNKLASKNKVTNVTSFDQLIELIKNGKRGDSFGLTVDYTGYSMGDITNTDGVEAHAFGHYTIEEINVSNSTLNSFQAFGSGEVSGKFIADDTKTYVHATTGFGRAVVLNTSATAFRVVEDGNLTYFLIGAETVTSFDGYYISI